MMPPASGVLTFTHNGVRDLDILESYYAALDRAYKRGVKDTKTARSS
jgi:hypothetical protein